MTRPERILVVGAGIAGCSAAIALASRGFGVTLVEKQAEWRFQSSGIFIYGNGLEALRAVGVLPRILEAGFAIEDGTRTNLRAVAVSKGFLKSFESRPDVRFEPRVEYLRE